MKIRRKPFVLAGALLIATAGAASAAITMPAIPAFFLDPCAAFAGCQTATWWGALSQAQTVLGEAGQLQNEATNLTSRAPTVGNIRAFIGTVTSAGRTINQMTKADVAANAVVNAAPANAALAAKANDDATSANGAQEQAQAGNEHLSAIDQTTQAQLDLAAEQQQQDAANRQAVLNALNPPATVPPPAFM